jgi:uncharacterized damage-inducible protein DinB
MLLQFLAYQRSTVRRKVDGLDHAQLNSASTVSSLTLAALLKHLALVEDSWIHGRFAGNAEPEPWASAPFDADDDWDFHSASGDTGEYLLELYAAAAARTDAIVAVRSLDDLSIDPDRNGNLWTLRWALLHLIEETARHAGHADLIREAIDGTTGE